MEATIEEIMKGDPDLNMEFIYAVRIVQSLSKINLKTECDQTEAIKMIERAFFEYKSKIKPETV